MAGLVLKDSARSPYIRREHAAGPLLLCVEKSQLRRFGYLIRRLLGHLPLELFWARPTGRKPRGRPRTRWRDYMSHLASEHPRIPQGGAGNLCRGEGRLEHPALPAFTAIRPQISGRKMIEWISCFFQPPSQLKHREGFPLQKRICIS